MSRICVALGVVVLVAASAMGCGDGEPTTIALLLPGFDVPRHEEMIRASFEGVVEEACASCQVRFASAGAKNEVQQRQSDTALKEGADVLVVDPVIPNDADRIVRRAAAMDVPVVSYDGLILEAMPSIFVSYGNAKTGELQAASLSKGLTEKGDPKGPIVFVNGEPGDQPQHEFKRGAYAGFEHSGVEITDEFFTPFSAAGFARRGMNKAIRRVGGDGFRGVYVETDEMAGGVVEALRAAGINPSARPLTGLGATPAGLRRILAGDQYMTVYEPIDPLARTAAKFAVNLAEDKGVPAGKINGRLENIGYKIPAVLLWPTAVTKGNIGSTVIADGYVSRAQLCAGRFLALCVENGIEGGSESGGGGSIGRAEFIEKADEICADSHREIAVKGVAELRKGVKAGKSKEEIEADVLEGLLVPTLEDELEAIRALGAPAGDEGEVEAFLAAFEEVIEEAREDPQTFIQSSGEYTFGHYRKPGHLMAAYGLSGCPQG